MGAGIPREIPGVLDAFVEHRSASIRFDVTGLRLGNPKCSLLIRRARRHGWHAAHSPTLYPDYFRELAGDDTRPEGKRTG